jgi:hypothetical protein
VLNKLIWTLQILAALAFGAGGGMKLVTAPADLRANPAMGWATDFSDGAIRAIGAAEVAGAVGLLVPAATGIAPLLTPAAGVGLAMLMGGAAYTHLQRNEPAVPPIVLGALALAAGVLRAKRIRGTSRN